MLAYCCMHKPSWLAQWLHRHSSVLLWSLGHLFFFHFKVNLSDLRVCMCLTGTSTITCMTAYYLCDNLRPIETHICNRINYVLVKVIITQKKTFLFLLYWVLDILCSTLIFFLKLFNHDIRRIIVVAIDLHLLPCLSLSTLIVLGRWRLWRWSRLWLVVIAHYYVVYDVEIVINETSCTVKGCASRRWTKDLSWTHLVISIWRLFWLGGLRLLLLVILRNRLWVRRLVERWVFTWRGSYIIVIIEWIEAHSAILSVVVLLLHVTKEVVLEEVVVIRILNSTTTTHTKVSSRGIIVGLISFLIQFLNYILMLDSVVREIVIIICRVYVVCLLSTSARSYGSWAWYLNLLLTILLRLLSIQANCIVLYFFNRYLSQDLGFELPSLISNGLCLVSLSLNLSCLAWRINLKPFILKNIISCWSIVCIRVQHPWKNIYKGVCHALIVKYKLTPLNSSIKLLICLASKWKTAIH